MSQIMIVGAAAIVGLVVYSLYEEKKKDKSPDSPSSNGSVGVLNPNGGLVPPGCSVWSGSNGTEGLWACPNVTYGGQTGVVISAVRYPAYDPVDPPISIVGSDTKYYFRQWLPPAIGV